LRLEHLELSAVENLTDRAIDIILESPCAQTLRFVDVSYAPQFSSRDVLRLVRGCPELAEFTWESHETGLDQNVDGALANVAAIHALLVSRGGKAYGGVFWNNLNL